MPDASGALTPDDYKKLTDWFATRWHGTVACHVCNATEWAYGSHVVKLPRHAGDSYMPGTSVFPYIPVHCKNCGHTMLFGAVIVGIVEPNNPATSAAKPSMVNNMLSAAAFPQKGE